jgi:lipopolysaccharide transport system ATP-binding protein
VEPIIETVELTKMFKIPHQKTKHLKSYLLNLGKARNYEKFYALKNINLEIYPGEFIGIIGLNGSGKSTLLKLIAGILYPTSGEVIVRELISPFLELGVGFNPELSGRDNIYLYGTIIGLTKKQIDDRFDEILEFSELERFIDSPLKNFSSGMSVRLAFSVAIQSNAPILLVDEVLAVGDAPFQKKCYEVFRRYKKEKKTIVFVSHKLDSIQEFCDRVFLLQKGREVMCGKPDEMVEYYVNSLTKTS